MSVTSEDVWPDAPTWRARWLAFLRAEKATALTAGGKEPAPRDGLVCDGKAGGLVIREKPAQGCDSTEK